MGRLYLYRTGSGRAPSSRLALGSPDAARRAGPLVDRPGHQAMGVDARRRSRDHALPGRHGAVRSDRGDGAQRAHVERRTRHDCETLAAPAAMVDVTTVADRSMTLAASAASLSAWPLRQSHR